MVIYGVVLAAGHGRRIGAPKALLRIGDETFHGRALRAFGDAGLPVVVVINRDIQAALPEALPNERRVVNPDPDHPSGMFGSVRLGLAAVTALGAGGAVLLPVDHPLVNGSDIRRVGDELAMGAALVVARHLGRRGHPVGISRAVMAEIASDPDTGTLRDVVRREPKRVVEVPVGEGAVLGVNTAADLDRISNRSFR